jgi:hypothetical protein
MKIAQNQSPPHRTTADKREIKDFAKLPSATSFIRKTLDEMRLPNPKNFYEHRCTHNRHQEESQ